MSIILRTNKGSALTYDEMDRNQSQFFYSSSLHDSNTKLRLHFTGSDSLDLPGVDYGPTRYHEIQFPSVDIEIPEGIAEVIILKFSLIEMVLLALILYSFLTKQVIY
jgi:hypothetical protein